MEDSIYVLEVDSIQMEKCGDLMDRNSMLVRCWMVSDKQKQWEQCGMEKVENDIDKAVKN